MSEEFLVTETRDREPTHPGAILHEDVLPALKLSISEAARHLGVTRQTLHRIIAITHSITPGAAARPVLRQRAHTPGKDADRT